MSAAVHRFPDRFDENGVRWEPWLDAQKIASHFDVDPRTVRRWREDGMPASPFKPRRYRVSECEAWLQERAS